ncbi:MAG TPA: YlxR family protein [Nocardioides sp.]
MVRELSLPARTRHDPVRTCIGCRERAARSELLRVVAGTDADGQPAVVPDPGRTAPGRGAHLHPTTACFDLAVRRRAFSRALRSGQALAGAPVAHYLASTAFDRD